MKDSPAQGTHSDNSAVQMANAIRALAMDAVQKANSGHPGMPMGGRDRGRAVGPPPFA